MTTTPGMQERAAFSARLRSALAAALGDAGPTALARAYNTLAPDAVTVHAARKWLVGEAIPTQPKIRLLAQLLGVTPEWLRYGAADAVPAAALAAADQLLLHDYHALPPAAQALVRRLIRDLPTLTTLPRSKGRTS